MNTTHPLFEVKLQQRSRLGFYFHLPFCARICPYCDFVKTSKWPKSQVERFWTLLSRQLDEMLSTLDERVDCVTLYFGGGTPGLFGAERYHSLFSKLSARFEIEEATLELNPGGHVEARLADYRAVGFDRVTFGVQSLCSEALGFLGRKHTARQALNSLEQARSVGFERVQADLMFGLLPGVRQLNVVQEISQLVAAGATGISAYALSQEKRTHFAQRSCADVENAASEYHLIEQSCAQLGMRQVETSNFSFFPSLHNNLYWHGYPYFGIGTGAHGLLPATREHPFGRRYRVGVTPAERAPGDDALDFVSDGEQLFQLIHEEVRSRSDYMAEMIFTLLRTERGIPLDWLRLHTGQFEAMLTDAKVMRALDEKRLLLTTENSLALSAREKFIGDSWALHLIHLLEKLEPSLF